MVAFRSVRLFGATSRVGRVRLLGGEGSAGGCQQVEHLMSTCCVLSVVRGE